MGGVYLIQCNLPVQVGLSFDCLRSPRHELVTDTYILKDTVYKYLQGTEVQIH